MDGRDRGIEKQRGREGNLQEERKRERGHKGSEKKRKGDRERGKGKEPALASIQLALFGHSDTGDKTSELFA